MPKTLDCAILEDHKLIAAIAEQCENSLDALYDKYADKMLGLACVMLKNKADAEDVIHDVFIEVWHKADSYSRKRGSVIAWLMLRVRSRCLDRFRMLTTLRKNDQKQILDEKTEDKNDEIYTQQHNKSTVNAALNTLTLKQRTVIEMSYFKGFTCVEISKLCDIPLGTVKTRLMSAMNSLRSYMSTLEADIL